MLTLRELGRGLQPRHWQLRVQLTLGVLTLLGAAAGGVACSAASHGAVAVTRSECATCHIGEFLATKQPPHMGVFPETCASCHAESAWTPAKQFDHAKFFELEGAHALISCTQCHTVGFKRGDTPKECVGCHRKEYDTNTFPGHETFGTDCAACHETVDWKPARTVDHDRHFKLEGKHVEVTCASCHTVGYAPGQTSKECVSCHRKDYDSSPFANHDTFPTTCADCHTSAGWKPATLPDHDRFFKLDGKHAQTACASCHTVGYAAGQTPSECVACHRADYDGSPYLGHDQFPTTCADCHMTGGWKPASGAHPAAKFPITSGPHKVVSCIDCHNASLGTNSKGNADCVGCHTGEHTRARMDEKHREESGYPSGAAPANFCLDCHPSGRE